MTIYTHALVGVGLAAVAARRRLPWFYWALAAILPVLPDLDALSTATYGTPWGHRGFTHSLVFALGLGLISAVLTYRYFQAKCWAMWGLYFVLVASHGVLDALTRGVGGIPFFWPLAEQRFGGSGPVPVSDIAFELPNPWASRAVKSELMWIWLPTGLLVVIMVTYRHYRRGLRKPS